MSELLRVQGLTVGFPTRGKVPLPPVLAGLDLVLEEGESLALVGPSGSGKSLTARAVLGLLPPGAVWSGDIRWRGQRLVDPGSSDWRALRGPAMTVVLQEPGSSLNPVRTIGSQVTETLRVRLGLNRRQATEAALEIMAEVGLPDPDRILTRYPHQLSGGLRQRATIAAALACRPDLIIADEPTTSLDLLAQKEIVGMLAELRGRRNTAMIFITHDQGLVPVVASRVLKMESGRAVPANSESLVSTVVPSPRSRSAAKPILAVKGLSAGYGNESGHHDVIREIDLELTAAEAVGLLGESGCGKTTLARVLAGQLRPTRGTVALDGKTEEGAASALRRRRVQLLLQDSGASLNPRQTVGAALEEAASLAPDRSAVNGSGQLLAEVGLDGGLADRYPHQLSGGQKQRVALARCLAVRPDVLIADEPTTALDAQARDDVLHLLQRIRSEYGLTLLVISHDPGVLLAATDRIVVMSRGGILVESMPTSDRSLAHHPHTLDLLAADPAQHASNPDVWGQVRALAGEPVDVSAGGCPFHRHCRYRKSTCQKELPGPIPVGPDHWSRCPEAPIPPSGHFIDT